MGIKRWVLVIFGVMVLTGCQRYEPAPELENGVLSGNQEDGPELENGVPSGEDRGEEKEEEGGSFGGENAETKADSAFSEEEVSAGPQIVIDTAKERTPVKVKGIYVSAYVAGMEEMMDKIIEQIDRTELNAVVIDVKDDHGNITFAMDSPVIQQLGSCAGYISDIQKLVEKLKEHDIYLIARIPAFRDPYLAQVRPEWCCKQQDGSVFLDRSGMAWVNPYKQEAWDYLVEIGKMAGEAGFDEVQFDYIRFCTERGMNQVIFEESDVQNRDRQEIILEFIQYAYDALAKEGLFVSADVFGVVMSGGEDAYSVGQDFVEMAYALDYLCPMIYPSHYSDGYFGIAHPDTRPYDTIAAALAESKVSLAQTGQMTDAEPEAGETMMADTEPEAQGKIAARERPAAVIRPWLQDFTASYLPHHISYGPQQVREQIQAVYDAGYEEWILWDAAVSYHYDGLLPAQ